MGRLLLRTFGMDTRSSVEGFSIRVQIGAWAYVERSGGWQEELRPNDSLAGLVRRVRREIRATVA